MQVQLTHDDLTDFAFTGCLSRFEFFRDSLDDLLGPLDLGGRAA